MQPYSQEPLFIDLDDPAPRWFRCCGVLAVILVVGLMIAPWAIDTEAQPTPPEGQPAQTRTVEYAAICQPTVDFPAFAEPAVSMALPGWMRLCDWFADPSTAPPVGVPTQPASGPLNAE